MTNIEIFYRILVISTQNGYVIPKYITLMTETLHCTLFDLKDLIVYSKDFAKIFFGEIDNIYSKNAWVNRLQEMSQAKDEFKYLEKFLIC